MANAAAEKLAVAETARLKLEAEERAVEVRREKQVEEIRRKAEAQPSKVDLEKVSQHGKKKKAGKLTPGLLAAAASGGGVPEPAPEPAPGASGGKPPKQSSKRIAK